jgi:secretion/DNA translocation related CpaE-like protein
MDIAVVERAGPSPLVVTADAALRERILLLCAASGVTPRVVDGASEARAEWRIASCVLIGHDAVETLPTDVPLPRRDDVTVVTDAHAHDASVWRGAVMIGAQSVAILPADQERLVGWLADVAEGHELARTVAVVGARGGVGASTFAATLAVRAARRAPTFLVDADPSGGGVELVFGSEHVDGLRWPDVALTDGRITASTLRGALPEHRGVTVLSWSRGPVTTVAAATMQSMVAAAARSFRHIVVDLPRTLDAAAGAALSAADTVVLLGADDVRSVAGTGAMLPALREAGADIGLVVKRSRRAVTPSPQALAASVGLPLLGAYAARRSVGRAIDEGFGPPRRGSLVRCCDAVLDRVTPTEAA